ncbi:hypothetical protein DENSPDRAFT_847994 [Dentipellis sp. KUC8613]|nr:hypothetical protein DENSPDRAFT_847994 [Dentipellis sp. KUC8613]
MCSSADLLQCSMLPCHVKIGCLVTRIKGYHKVSCTLFGRIVFSQLLAAAIIANALLTVQIRSGNHLVETLGDSEGVHDAGELHAGWSFGPVSLLIECKGHQFLYWQILFLGEVERDGRLFHMSAQSALSHVLMSITNRSKVFASVHHCRTRLLLSNPERPREAKRSSFPGCTFLGEPTVRR